MKKNLLGQSIDFIIENRLDITLVVLIIFLIISYMIISGHQIEKTHPTLKKVIIFENFKNSTQAFCKQTNQMENPDANCNQLEKKTCSNDVDCCLFDVSKNKCVSATSGRPTNHNLGIDEWYYLGELKKN